MSTILLLGGTGAMGRNLGRKLAERGGAVFITSRQEMVDDGNVHFIRGNAKDDSFLQQVLRTLRPDALIDFMIYDFAEFAARKDALLNGTGQYMFVSSCRVFAGEAVHTERSPRLLDVCTDVEYLKSNDYALVKAREEDLLRNSGKSNWTIVRPCITYSYPRLQFGCLEANAFLPRVAQGLPVPMPPEMMKKRTTMLHGDDVAEMMARLILNEKAIGDDFNTVTAENHTWEEIANIYADAIGLKVAPCTLSDYKKFCFPYQVQYGRMVHHCFDNMKVLLATGMKQKDLSSLPKTLTQEAIKFNPSDSRIRVDVYRNAAMDRILKTRFKVSSGFHDRLNYFRARYSWLGHAMSMASAIKRIYD